MTDKELLEAAAKAAGINLRDDHYWDDVACMWVQWNPLTDDGDALRLAVNLGMSLDTALGQTLAVVLGDDDCVELHDGVDKYAATRRAIVRAAAGKDTQ